MTPPSISLIVLRSAKLEASLAFYRALGLSFIQERHGTGPVHYSCQIGDLVLEIYPGAEGLAPNPKNGGATMLGFQVESLDSTVNSLQPHGATVLSPPKDTLWGRRMVVADPDGRAVEITQARSAS